jgi:hypothetical protein
MIIVIALITTVLVLLFVVYKMYWLKKPKSREISIEEVEKLIEDDEFWNTVKKVVEGKHISDESIEDTGYVVILKPCEGYDCPCNDSREDCCLTGVEIEGKKYCKCCVDINKLCGLPGTKKKPDVSKILTDEECKILAEKIVENMEEIQNNIKNK